jgi:hypothetical protein
LWFVSIIVQAPHFGIDPDNCHRIHELYNYRRALSSFAALQGLQRRVMMLADRSLRY